MQNFAENLSKSEEESGGAGKNAHPGGFRVTDVALVEGTDISFVGPVAKQILHNWSIAPKQPQPSLQQNLMMAPRMQGPSGMGGGGMMGGGMPASPYNNGGGYRQTTPQVGQMNVVKNGKPSEE
ncbi:MAG: hypothetical protein EP349_02200 [Alphaproteobacteria bacterium]|nr:MAG: hypothetical protein EP349_02200 [Alphaproteobacteria bacterium]